MTDPDHTTVNHAAFRRGIHTAVQAIVDNHADLVQRRQAAHSPEQLTQAIVAMTKRIAEMAFPTEDPGPSPTDPTTPALQRPPTETLLAVAALAAEASGLPITLQITSDGVLVQGTHAATHSSRLRQVSWTDIVSSPSPVLSIAVRQVAEELST